MGVMTTTLMIPQRFLVNSTFIRKKISFPQSLRSLLVQSLRINLKNPPTFAGRRAAERGPGGAGQQAGHAGLPERRRGPPGPRTGRPQEPHLPDLQDVGEEGRGPRARHGLALERPAGQEMIERYHRAPTLRRGQALRRRGPPEWTCSVNTLRR